MPQGGVTNQIGVKRKSSSFIGHTLYSASPHYPFQILLLLSPFFSFPISSFLPLRATYLTFFSSNPLLIFSSVTYLKKATIFLFPCPVVVNNRKEWKCLCLKTYQGFGSPAPLLHYYKTGNGWLLPNAEAWMCISASMATPMVLSMTVRVYGSFISESSVILVSARACCSASCWIRSHTGWCVGWGQPWWPCQAVVLFFCNLMCRRKTNTHMCKEAHKNTLKCNKPSLVNHEDQRMEPCTQKLQLDSDLEDLQSTKLKYKS